MLKNSRSGLIFVILVSLSMSLFAQNGTRSPYTRYGYGMLSDRSFGAGRSMGGTGYGLHSSKQINPMNPASYTSMDSLTFLFDVGATAQMSWFDDGQRKQNDLNGSFEYAAMQFRLHKRLAVSFGILPYSSVGYDYMAPSQGKEGYTDVFSGTGGLNEVYGGLSIEIWKKRLSVGANVSYMFGNINHQSSTNLNIPVYRLNKLVVHNPKYDVGMQYTHPLTKTDRLTFGLVYSPKRRLKTTAYDVVSNSEYFERTIEGDTLRNQGFDIPHSYGFGLSYTRDYQMMLAADISYQEWSGAKFFNRSDDFKDRLRVALGGEYIPNNFTRSYLNRIRYRAGLHYGNSYLKVNGSGYKEYGATLGVGFPMLDNRSFINASFEYVKIIPDSKTLINEQYLRFTVSYTFNEYWFFKFKQD